MWLDRFESPLPIRCRGTFHVYSANAGPTPVVVVVPSDPTSQPAADCLDKLAAAHRLLDGDGLPPLHEAGRSGDTPFVALGCDALWDGEAVMARLGEVGMRVPYDEAVAVVDRVTGALAKAHTRGHALGSLAWANVLIGRDGKLHLFGFGHNVVTLNERGFALGAPSAFLAPEVAAGGPPTPSADLYAYVVWQRALLAYCEMPAELTRAFADPSQADGVGALVSWANQKIVTAPPAERPTMAEARRHFAGEWQHLNISPAHAALQARLVQLLDAEDSPGAMEEPGDRVVIGRDAEWVRAPSGERHVISRLPLRRLLLKLVAAREAQPGTRLDVDALLEAGWPGEQPIREAGLNRVYVAISLLRKLGLRDVLERNAEGYRLDPDVAVSLERNK